MSQPMGRPSSLPQKWSSSPARMICLPSYRYSGPMKPDGVDQQRIECASHGIGAGFTGLLVDSVMRLGGERTSLPGFEIHDVVADCASMEFQGGFAGFFEHRQIHAEAGICFFRAGDGLED